MGKLTEILRRTLSSGKIKEDAIVWQAVSVKKQDVICFNLSTNPLLGFKQEGQLYFFRECPSKQSRKQQIRVGIDRFFAYIHNDQVEKLNFAQELPIQISFDPETVAEFKSYIDEKQSGAFLKKLSNAYNLLNGVGYSIWAEDNRVPDALFAQLGLTDLKDELVPIATYFLWCMRAVMASFETQIPVKGKSRYYYNGVRAMSTEIVAKLLQAEDLVTRSNWCRLDIEGDVRYGVLSKAAEGKRAADMTCPLTGALQRDLISLHVLDALCFQQDHGPNNYNIIQSDGAKSSVCAFDNDNPNTFFPINRVDMPLAGCAPLVSDGRFNRPYISKTLAENLLHLDQGKLIEALSPWLNNMQIKALLLRLQQLQNAVEHSDAAMLNDDDWNEETVQAELTGTYGKTYLVKLSEQMN